MTDIPSEIMNLGPTAGVLVVVWAFLRFLGQQRDAAAQEAREERAEVRVVLERMVTSHEKALEGISGRVDKLIDAQLVLTKAIEAALPSANS